MGYLKAIQFLFRKNLDNINTENVIHLEILSFTFQCDSINLGSYQMSQPSAIYLTYLSFLIYRITLTCT